MNTYAHIDDPIVEIASGKLCGGATPAGYSFKGIPYGGSTAGANRFLAPSPAPTWRGIREARDFGLRCPQNDGVIKPANAWIRDVQTTGEDCLSLNVWAPSLDDTARDTPDDDFRQRHARREQPATGRTRADQCVPAFYL